MLKNHREKACITINAQQGEQSGSRMLHAHMTICHDELQQPAYCNQTAAVRPRNHATLPPGGAHLTIVLILPSIVLVHACPRSQANKLLPCDAYHGQPLRYAFKGIGPGALLQTDATGKKSR